jgi:hypothetical protein
MSQEMLKFLIIDPQDFLVSPVGLKQALVTMVKKTWAEMGQDSR